MIDHRNFAHTVSPKHDILNHILLSLVMFIVNFTLLHNLSFGDGTRYLHGFHLYLHKWKSMARFSWNHTCSVITIKWHSGGMAFSVHIRGQTHRNQGPVTQGNMQGTNVPSRGLFRDLCKNTHTLWTSHWNTAPLSPASTSLPTCLLSHLYWPPFLQLPWNLSVIPKVQSLYLLKF